MDLGTYLIQINKRKDKKETNYLLARNEDHKKVIVSKMSCAMLTINRNFKLLDNGIEIGNQKVLVKIDKFYGLSKYRVNVCKTLYDIYKQIKEREINE